MPSYCYLTPCKKTGGIYIECSYDPDFNEALKRHVPAGERKWDPELKRWWVSEKWKKQAEIDCRAFFENVQEC